MAKQLYELKDFSGGVISNADLADIPEGASELSLNISPMGKLGAIEPIKTETELMLNVPHITNMAVRDGIDKGDYHLAVNIRENFIFIPNYASDVKLADFIEIAEAGQLFYTPTPQLINDQSPPLDTNTGNAFGMWTTHEAYTDDLVYNYFF